MDPINRDLQKFSRIHIFDIWSRAKLGEPLEGEEEVVAELMQLHTDFHDTWDNADKLLEHEYDPDKDVNPFLHIAIDTIIVNQITQNDPPEVNRAYDRLCKRGTSRLDAIHMIDSVFTEELWPVLKYNRPFNNESYIKKVKKLSIDH